MRTSAYNFFFNWAPSPIGKKTKAGWLKLSNNLLSWSLNCMFQSCHVRVSEWIHITLYSCLNVRELLAQNRRDIWSLSDYNKTWTHNHLVRKWTLNHLAKLAKWLSCVMSTYCMVLLYVLLYVRTVCSYCLFLNFKCSRRGGGVNKCKQGERGVSNSGHFVIM